MITLTTDFGDSEYVAAMKGAILTINPDAKMVDITHSIQPQDVMDGAYVLHYSCHMFPERTIHLAVIDPEVGTTRGMLVFKCKKGIMVGPDNGLMVQAAQRMGIEAAYRITNTELFRKDVSHTFHGRDIFAPVAARLDMGTECDKVGPQTTEWVDLDILSFEATETEVRGKVLHVDDFGNLITSIPYAEVEKHYRVGDKLPLILGRRSLSIPVVSNYVGHTHRYLVSLASSDGFLEIAHPNHSAAALLKIDVGKQVILEI